MKPGDMVRLAHWGEIVDINDWSTTPKKHIGLLVGHCTIMKIATVLCNGEMLEIRSQLVEKAGRKDFEDPREIEKSFIKLVQKPLGCCIMYMNWRQI